VAVSFGQDRILLVHSTAPSQGHGLALLTCSMAADSEIFALLAASIDRHVDPAIRHDVVVPAADLAAFRPFATGRRRLLAQEEVLPVRLRRLPSALRLLAAVRPMFRRPLYLAPGGRLVRGWMVQQCLKIEMARRCPEAAIMHVDSDVAFFRALRPGDAFEGDRVRFFRAEGATRNPMHGPWIAGASAFLGVPAPASWPAHYVENCVLWSSAAARAMVGRIEAVHGRPFHEVIFAAETMSEYYLYGLHADLFPEAAALAPGDVSFCNSYWPADESAPVDFEALRRALRPRHCAVAIQSTHQADTEARRALYARAERELA
jgi:hypothetical protein